MPMNDNYFLIPTSSGKGMIVCGNGEAGVLGTGKCEHKHKAIGVSTPMNIKSVSTGADHCVAVDVDGCLWSWGQDSEGKLGLGPSLGVAIPKPTQLFLSASFAQVSVGSSFTLALDSEGFVWSFGRNNYGQLGLGDYMDRSVPTKIRNIPRIHGIATGESHSLILDHAGIVMSFGCNLHSQLGSGNPLHRKSPLPIESKAGAAIGLIADIACGFQHCLVLDYDGRVWSFGSNFFGQLGLHKDVYGKKHPTRIPKLKSVRRILCGGLSSYTVDDQGRVMVFGSNQFSQLGLSYSSAEDSFPPTRNPELDNKRLVAGGHHLLSIDQQGHLRFYGKFSNQQRGDDYYQLKHLEQQQALQHQPESDLGINVNISLNDLQPEEDQNVHSICERAIIAAYEDVDVLPQCGKRSRDDLVPTPEPQPKRSVFSGIAGWFSLVASYISSPQEQDES